MFLTQPAGTNKALEQHSSSSNLGIDPAYSGSTFVPFKKPLGSARQTPGGA